MVVSLWKKSNAGAGISVMGCGGVRTTLSRAVCQLFSIHPSLSVPCPSLCPRNCLDSVPLVLANRRHLQGIKRAEGEKDQGIPFWLVVFSPC